MKNLFYFEDKDSTPFLPFNKTNLSYFEDKDSTPFIPFNKNLSFF